MKHLKYKIKTEHNDSICIALVVSILETRSRNLTCLEIDVPTASMTERIRAMYLDFSNLKTLHIGSSCSEVGNNIYGVIINGCHNLQNIRIDIESQDETTDLLFSLEKFGAFCVNNCKTLKKIRINMWGHMNYESTMIFRA